MPLARSGPRSIHPRRGCPEHSEDLQALLVSCYDVLANLYDGDVQLINELRGDNVAQPASNFDFKAIYDRSTIRWTSYTGGVNRDFFYPVLRVNSLLESFDLIEGLTPEERTRMNRGKICSGILLLGRSQDVCSTLRLHQ